MNAQRRSTRSLRLIASELLTNVVLHASAATVQTGVVLAPRPLMTAA